MIYEGMDMDGRGTYCDRGITGDTGWFMKLTNDWYINDDMKGITLL